ncbi:MAG: hypothetical protein ACLRFI_01980 [Alphaproteobacteria bacterium]
MLNDTNRKEILSMLKKYKYANAYLFNHYNSRRANITHRKCHIIADGYLQTMKNNMDKITSDDAKYFALIVDNFEQLNRGKLFSDLQKHADFDVNAFVGGCKIHGIKPMLETEKIHIPEKSIKYMKKLCKKYKNVCKKLSDGKHRNSYYKLIKRAENYRHDAYTYARSIVTGEVDVSDKNLRPTINFLNVICFPHIDGDDADLAKQMLQSKIDSKINPKNIIDTKSSESKPNFAFKNRITTVRENLNSVTQKFFEPEPNKDNTKEKHEQKFLNLASKFGTRVQEKLQNVKSGIKNKIENKNTEKANQPENQDKNTDNKKHWYHKVVRVALPVIGIAMMGVGISMLTKDSGNKKTTPEPQKKEIKASTKITTPTNNITSAKTVVPIDTAYMQAMNNYCNSAMDIIAGNKKDDVLKKLNAQVESGNLVLQDTISIERVAYTYFIYREYGFNIDILNKVVNGNEKLSDTEQSELLKVINDAGERGCGVKKMAQEKLSARGGTLGQHSKFEHATKSQQRAYLVSRGVLKKTQHTR